MKTILILTLLSLLSYRGYSQQYMIYGQVRGANIPLEGINIKVKGQGISVKSNVLGKYRIGTNSSSEIELQFSGVGYHSKNLKLKVFSDSLLQDMELMPQTSTLNDVVITGVSRATQLRKSPIPIAVLSKKTMDQNVNTNLIEAIVKGVPGVTAVTTGPNVSKPFIRGLGYNRVLTMYDGLRQEGQQWGDEHGIEVDEYGVGRAEVVKGPASLTYGSDALAGVVNMIPTNPDFEGKTLKGDFTSNYQTNNGLLGASLGLAYLKNNWKYTFRTTGRMAHAYQNRADGYVYGTAFKEYNLSASARVDKVWGFSKTAVTYYDNMMEIPDGSRDSVSRRFTKQILDDGDDIKNRPIVGGDALSSYKINPLHQHIQHFRLYNTSQFKFKNSDLNVLIGAQQSIRREYNHPTLPSQSGLHVILNTLNYDLKYNLPNFSGIESTVGINGMFQGNRSKDATDFPIPNYSLFDIGGFYFAKKEVGKLAVSGGIRFDRRNTRWDNFYVGVNPATGFGQQVNGSVSNAQLQFPAFNKNFYGVSGSLGITYNLTEKLLFKANIARGYRAPNINEIGANGLDPGAHIVYLGNRNFKPEFNLQEDFGLLAYLQDVDLSVEVFNNNIQNYIYQSRLSDENGQPVIIVPGNLTYQYQQATAKLYGFEFSANVHPQGAKWLNFNNSMAYVIGLNTNKQSLLENGEAAKYLPFIPPFQVRSELKITAQKPISFFSQPYVKVDVTAFANQNKFYALDETESFTSGYALLNAGLGSTIKQSSGKVLMDLFIQVDNIFNKSYQSHLNRLKYFEYYQNVPNGRSGIFNMGRNISFKAIFPF
ncbi:TonB-dependent receptor [Pedobacter sandarakinus]|uniref:TonB-dependent receptor n=1 Tax=Pedobacter sandarakinus TaxID=353156 RepID=UPI00224553FB|nr:TonB-dependent receptor [Pedobacter sandarakinus]MCX2574424.1 TonB-dependent receptor [Pedobacter sandarakinus]